MISDYILVVEDDEQIAHFLVASLSAAKHASRLAKSLEEANKYLVENTPKLMVLDLGLPDGDGKDLIRQVRKQFDFPIIVLSARQEEQEKIVALNEGADDYLSKPFNVEELLARINVCLRRTQKMFMRDQRYQYKDLLIDVSAGLVKLEGNEIHLSPIEHKLLMLLATKPGKIFTQRQLLSKIWGSEYVDDTHYLRIHMGRLRAKIEKVSAEPEYLLTELGIGYRLAIS
ncbi:MULTISPECIES: response regulator [unclassified Polynucleobacter]|jgi:two-component system KDP operon response regulator KdpE|uniref:response regulator n=1 Tax=unclassified Polynucleobacter TaxID=2640945 RepID=UPI000BD4440C|nr:MULTISPECIES: response regulator [unclassified Polynucleobacter]OYY18633.1 MAG: two-component system response regulator KdpE [Polynucleobacter sp. 35-46-11]OZA76226.1 MAG: two-component system response regulator KdpE [Polynucleobacter sp. 39-46-10]